MIVKKRNYKKEYKDYHSKPLQKKRRVLRNKARSILGLKVGDPREADHKKPLSKGGSNNKSNLRAVSRTVNRKKATK
jgi:5-methylcytosine-specific restriction endonuclease McrA